jgi:hypothetical protein
MLGPLLFLCDLSRRHFPQRWILCLPLVIALGVSGARKARAQGGPPMLTDDPGTPGNGHTELNLAVTIERRADEQLWELPIVDMNYGVGERIQLNFETSFNALQRDDRGAVAGPGSTSVAIKWRFFDQGHDGFSVSTYPRIEWNTFPSSVHRGLVEDGTRGFLPMQIAHGFGPFDLDIEVGSLLSTIGRAEWVYGFVAGLPVTSKTNLMAELHGSARTNFNRDELTVNVGVRQKFNDSVALIASLGRDLRSPPGERIPLIGYLGMQLEF